MFIIIIYCTSCKENQNKVVTIHAGGLYTDSLNPGPLFFLNKDTGFILGSYLVDAKNPVYPKKDDREYLGTKWVALLWKTIDGGRNWTKKIWGEGHIAQIDRFGDSVIALMKTDRYTRVFISSVFNPDNWKEITYFPRYAYHICASGNQMAALKTDSFKYKIFFCFSDNGGRDWMNNCEPIHDPYQYPVLKDGKLFYLARFESDKKYPDSLVVYDFAKNSDKLIKLPKDFLCLGVSCVQNNIYLTGFMSGGITIYQLDPTLEFKKLYTYAANNLSDPLVYYKSNGADWIFAVENNGSRKKIAIIKTSDNGKSFETSRVDYIRNIYLHSFIEQDSVVKVWFFNESGKFQIFESKNK
jgi:hypothetical protein